MESHYESIVQRWLKQAYKLDSQGLSLTELASRIVSRGGWGCYATLIQLHIHLNEHTKRNENEIYPVVGVSQMILDEITRICLITNDNQKNIQSISSSTTSPPISSSSSLSSPEIGPRSPQYQSTPQFIFNRQHNGLGNQIFQYIFTRLLSRSSDRLFQTSLIEPLRGEAPWKKIEYPPNSMNGWDLFQRLFHAEQTVPSMNQFPIGANVTRCLVENQRCIISDRPYDQHVHKTSLLVQLIRALYSEKCSQKCVFVIGYLQEPLFFTPWKKNILEWLNIEEDKRTWLLETTKQNNITTQHNHDKKQVTLYPLLGDNDIVVHVRCCQHSGGGCDWLYLPFEYYDAILSRLTARTPDPINTKVYVVAPCQTDCPMMDSFRRKYQAVHVTPSKWRNSDKQKMIDTMSDDFRFLLHAPVLVLGKSTFGFWAGWLSTTAKQVHMPYESRHHHFEKIPILAGDARFVYHNPGGDQWFGQVQGSELQLRYEEKGRWFGPKKFDEAGNFLREYKHQN